MLWKKKKKKNIEGCKRRFKNSKANQTFHSTITQNIKSKQNKSE